ncbi:hypothetical protein [Proteiniclasticum ruminis]|uniref:FlgN protein n=1 Tax=Proteiniclasticum ruminis TaxID=398199 RepID=A0A1I5CAW5_9CLOT|nr:hypothetical protein [Proteiniclasticum ruminis]SFN83781.1 hypothetical protein SAMN04488695_10641 [Proteiniclasticum ruminis]
MKSRIELLKEKRNLLLEAFEETQVDFKNPEECILAIAKNSGKIEEMKSLDEMLREMTSLSEEGERSLEEEIHKLLLGTKGNLEVIIKGLQKEKRVTTESMTDFARIKSIANSYVKTAQGPVFVDRDFE